ncbi:alpha/beta fold hydrolase [Altererythrobacter sp. Z27]|uniref:alpha/beta fold hydrolase n=1 Tax=Altererythrobacter sp. Z27 TaxID=3461147 RepID=UPI004044BBC8
MRPLLFVHGAPGDARMWTPVIDRLATRLDARAITLSFFGSREMPEGGEAFGTEQHAQDILDYVETMLETPVDVVAWSYGVHPVLLAALRRPELFGRLFLYEPGLPTYVSDPDALAEFEADAGQAFGPIFAALQAKGPEAAIKVLIDGSGGQGCFDGMSEERRDLYLDSAGMMPLLLGGGQPPAPITSEQLAGLDMPVIVATGADTRPIFAVPSRALAKALPKGELLTIPAANHMLPEANPASFAMYLREWLEQ